MASEEKDLCTTIPALTLGIAVYRSAPFIKDLLYSLERLTVFPERILLVDDCSPDNSAETIFAFAKAHPHIKIEIIRNNTNLGIAGTYNRIIDLSTTDWLQILDADDYFANDFFKAVAAELTEGVSVIATSFTSNIRLFSIIGRLLSLFVGKRIPEWLPFAGIISTRSGIIYNRNILKNIPFSDPIFPGSDMMNLMQMRKNGKTVFLRRPRIFYRLHRGSASAHISYRKYEELLGKNSDVPWLYKFDLVLRKTVLAFIKYCAFKKQ